MRAVETRLNERQEALEAEFAERRAQLDAQMRASEQDKVHYRNQVLSVSQDREKELEQAIREIDGAAA